MDQANTKRASGRIRPTSLADATGARYPNGMSNGGAFVTLIATRNRQRIRELMGSATALAVLLAVTAEPSPSRAQEASEGTTQAAPQATGGAPLPRFVSLKSDKVNLRTGPGTEYPTQWVYKRAGLPVEVTKEFEGWRQVRDSEGASGWILQSLLSGRRTALILPWELKDPAKAPRVTVREDDSENSRAVAIVEAGVIADVHRCDGRWCQVSIRPYRGYIEQKKLWGVYEGEVFN